MTVRTGFGLIGMLGQFDGEEGPRRVQEFEQATDQTFRDLRQEISGLETTVNQNIEQNTTEITGIATDNSELEGRVTALESRVTALENPPAAPYGYTGGVTSAVVTSGSRVPFGTPTLRGGMTVLSGGGGWLIPEDGVYQISIHATFRSASSFNPATVIIRVRRNGSSTPGDAIGRRWNTNTGNTCEISFSISRFLEAGDEIELLNQSGTTITQGTTASQTRYTIAKVSE
jgi:polyhydroxyalkanoate synthesis regulator phasin